MHLLVGFGNQHTLARLRRRGHCDVQRLFAADKDDLLFRSRNCRVKEISPEHFFTVCAGRHNDRIVLAALTLVHRQL